MCSCVDSLTLATCSPVIVSQSVSSAILGVPAYRGSDWPIGTCGNSASRPVAVGQPLSADESCSMDASPVVKWVIMFRTVLIVELQDIIGYYKILQDINGHNCPGIRERQQ